MTDKSQSNNDNINIIRYDLIISVKLICVRFLAVAAYDKKCLLKNDLA